MALELTKKEELKFYQYTLDTLSKNLKRERENFEKKLKDTKIEMENYNKKIEILKEEIKTEKLQKTTKK